MNILRVSRARSNGASGRRPVPTGKRRIRTTPPARNCRNSASKSLFLKRKRAGKRVREEEPCRHRRSQCHLTDLIQQRGTTDEFQAPFSPSLLEPSRLFDRLSARELRVLAGCEGSSSPISRLKCARNSLLARLSSATNRPTIFTISGSFRGPNRSSTRNARKIMSPEKPESINHPTGAKNFSPCDPSSWSRTGGSSLSRRKGPKKWHVPTVTNSYPVQETAIGPRPNP